jgi:hypothetical protein
MHPAVKRAGLDGEGKPRVRVHDVRHCFASLLIASGASVTFVASQLGHSSPSVTLNVYAHLFDEAEHGARLSAILEDGFGNTLETAVAVRCGQTRRAHTQTPLSCGQSRESAVRRGGLCRSDKEEVPGFESWIAHNRRVPKTPSRRGLRRHPTGHGARPSRSRDAEKALLCRRVRPRRTRA